MLRVTLALAAIVALCASATASAQDRLPGEIDPPPAVATTSGDASLLSGRTNGTGEVMIAGAAGWPWIWAQVDIAFDPAFNLGIRASLLYGSPFMAFEPGVGGEASLPMRFHVYGEDRLDLAIFATPAAVFGEAATTGQGGTAASGEFGWGLRLEGGLLAGYQALDRVTLILGAGGHLGMVNTPSASDFNLVGAAFLRAGVEGLISRDTLLFVLADGGVGFSPTRTGGPLFRESFPPVFRISLGVGYLL